MIVSGFGLVAKLKSEKARKTKDEGRSKKKQRDKTAKVDGGVCEQCQIATMRAMTHFQFPDRSNSSTRRTSSGYGSIGEDSQQQLDSIGELVTIGTGEGHCLRVNQLYFTVDLQKDSTSSPTSHFRKRVLQREVTDNGETETVVFSSDKDPDFYITTNRNRHLELNYFSDAPLIDDTDERVFLIYTTSTNQKIIQPYNFKGFYLHHLDSHLDVTRFDINFRAPEEYFFQFDTVPDPMYIRQPLPEIVCMHAQTNELDKVMQMTDTDSKSKQKHRKGAGFLSKLFLGCVSQRSQNTLEQTSGFV